MTPEAVNDFWFSDAARKLWFRATPAFDAEIATRVEGVWRQARDGDCGAWEQSSLGALALVIVLDQFPLNMYRNQALAYATEARSREVAGRAIERGYDQELPDDYKAFLYLPYMHSENLIDQERSIELFSAAGLNENLRFAKHHREIILRFGRFPHRNEVLGRDSTPEETEWLASAEGFNP